jgi:hypothetical protein
VTVASRLTLTSSINPSTPSEPVTFTAAVTLAASTANLKATGTVSFLDGGAALGAGTVDANGIATLTTASLSPGTTHTITATYAGATTAAGSILPGVSNAVMQTVAGAITAEPSGFLMTLSQNPVYVSAGGSAVLTISVVENSGFIAPVTLSCDGVPRNSTCGFAGAVIPAGGGITTLELSTSGPGACGNPSEPYASNRHPGLTGLAFAGAFLGLLAIPRRRRPRLVRWMVVAWFAGLAGVSTLAGCGGNCTDLGTLPGTYTLSVTGTPGQTSTNSTSAPVGPQTIHLVLKVSVP